MADFSLNDTPALGAEHSVKASVGGWTSSLRSSQLASPGWWSHSLTSQGSGGQDPSILSGSVPKIEPLFHELGAGQKQGVPTY